MLANFTGLMERTERCAPEAPFFSEYLQRFRDGKVVPLGAAMAPPTLGGDLREVNMFSMCSKRETGEEWDLCVFLCWFC